MEPQEHPEDLQEEATPHGTPSEGLARPETAHSQVPVPADRLLADVHHLYPDRVAYPGPHLHHHQVPARECRLLEDVEEDYHLSLAL